MTRTLASALALFLLVPSLPCQAQMPLSPIIEVIPGTLDFGALQEAASRTLDIEVRNAADDPSSQLRITNISVAGEDYRIIRQLVLPDTLSGDDPRGAHVTVGFCPSRQGQSMGTITITSPNAVNSPFHVALLGIGTATNAPAGHFILEVTPDTFGPEAPLEGLLEDFDFRCPSLRQALSDLQVTSLRRVMPWFDRENIHRTNAFGEEITLFDLSTIYEAELAAHIQSAVPAVSALYGRECIVYAQLDLQGRITMEPNDAHYQADLQWGLNNTGPTSSYPGADDDTDTNGPEAWDWTTGDDDVWVAVLDTGIDSLHTDLAQRVKNGPNFVTPGAPPYDDLITPSYGHGTPVAGIIGAVGNNQTGIAGTAWNVKLVAVKACDDSGSCGLDNQAAAISWAGEDNRISILNASFGSFFNDSHSWPIEKATRNAAILGKLLVASMGNDGIRVELWPAYSPSTFAVGAVWMDGARWLNSHVPGAPSGGGSNHGHWIDVVAPGGATIVTTARGGGFTLPTGAPTNLWTGTFGGTSAAAPHAAGIAALLKSYAPILDGDDLQEVMKRTAKDLLTLGHDNETGFGIVSGDTAIRYVTEPFRSVQHFQFHPAILDSTLTQIHFRDLQNLNYPVPDGMYQCVRYEMGVTLVFSQAFAATPAVWGRTSGTQGWRKAGYAAGFEPFFMLAESPATVEVGFTTPVLTTTKTYVYRVLNGAGQPIAWVPKHPNDAWIAITAVGKVSPIGVADQHLPQRPAQIVAMPNPTSGATRFSIDLPYAGRVALRIYDPAGRLVRTVANVALSSGPHNLSWDGRNEEDRTLSQGVYFWELEWNGEQLKRDKLLIIR